MRHAGQHRERIGMVQRNLAQLIQAKLWLVSGHSCRPPLSPACACVYPSGVACIILTSLLVGRDPGLVRLFTELKVRYLTSST